MQGFLRPVSSQPPPGARRACMVMSSGLAPERPSAKPGGQVHRALGQAGQEELPVLLAEDGPLDQRGDREVVHRADDPQRRGPAGDRPQDPRALHRVGAQAAVLLRDQEAGPLASLSILIDGFSRPSRTSSGMALRPASSPGMNRSSRARSAPRKCGAFGSCLVRTLVLISESPSALGFLSVAAVGSPRSSLDTLSYGNPAAIGTPPTHICQIYVISGRGIGLFSRSARPIAGEMCGKELETIGVRAVEHGDPECELPESATER